jgi:hypothetical protein
VEVGEEEGEENGLELHLSLASVQVCFMYL